MNFKLPGQTLLQEVMHLVNRTIEGQQQDLDTPPDAFYAEVHELEQKLSSAPTRPSRVIRNHSKLLEPITEQQKIMDMSG